jgi:hypothetical protein
MVQGGTAVGPNDDAKASLPPLPGSPRAASPPSLPSADHWGALLVIAPLCVAAMRQAGEVIIGLSWPEGAVFQNFVVFYLVTELVVLWLLHVTTRRPFQELAGFVALGLLIGTLPPVLDGLLFREPNVTYVYFTEFRWLFSSKEQPAGETACIWLGLLAIGGFAGWVTRRAVPAVVTWVGAYAAMQVLGGGLPMLVHWLAREQHGARSILHHVLMLSVAFATLAALRPRALGYSLGRLNHALPFVGVTAIGARLAGDGWLLAGAKAGVTLLASALVIAANDWYDRHQDGAGRAPRPMAPDDVWLVSFLQLLLCTSVAWFLREALVGIALFTAVTLAYHHPATRLKRWLGAAYASEGLAALACFLVGALRPGRAPPFLPGARAVALGLALAPVGFFLGSLFKDYKDVEADDRAGVRTIYTELARRGLEPRRASWMVAAILAACLAVATALVAAAGASSLVTVALAALTLLAVPSLLLGRPRAAVERTIWVVSVHLLVAALALQPG